MQPMRIVVFKYESLFCSYTTIADVACHVFPYQPRYNVRTVQSSVALRNRGETLCEMPLANIRGGWHRPSASRGSSSATIGGFNNELKEAGSDE
jgi:hypothetical protein